MNKQDSRTRRHRRVRAKVAGTEKRPRLAVYKSNTRLIAQIINDAEGATIVSISSTDSKGKTPRERAKRLPERWQSLQAQKG